MNNRGKIAEFGPGARAIDVWENEGGASGSPLADAFYGRRVEADKSWTVYHVFTGEVARIAGETMSGLTRSQATDRMLSHNRLSVLRRRERNARPRSQAISTGAGGRL